MMVRRNGAARRSVVRSLAEERGARSTAASRRSVEVHFSRDDEGAFESRVCVCFDES